MHCNNDTQVDDDWRAFVFAQKESDLSVIIEDERLKSDETRRFMAGAFRDGVMKTTGTDVDGILPPVSRFSSGRAGDTRAIKKQGVIEKLAVFFEKYLGLV